MSSCFLQKDIWLFGVFEDVGLIIWGFEKIAWHEHSFPKVKETPWEIEEKYQIKSSMYECHRSMQFIEMLNRGSVWISIFLFF